MNFRRLLSSKRQKEIAEQDEVYEEKFIVFRSMNSQNLASTLEFYTSNMSVPWKYEPGCPVYDATFWHIIIPEVLRRLRKGE
jgi:hypothetical protein